MHSDEHAEEKIYNLIIEVKGTEIINDGYLKTLKILGN